MATKIPILFEILKKRGITQRKLAEDTGISTGNISDWKSGKSAPKPAALAKIAQYLNCSVDYLLGSTDAPTPLVKSSAVNIELIEMLSQLTPAEQEMISLQIKGILTAKKNPPPNGDG